MQGLRTREDRKLCEELPALGCFRKAGGLSGDWDINASERPDFVAVERQSKRELGLEVTRAVREKRCEGDKADEDFDAELLQCLAGVGVAVVPSGWGVPRSLKKRPDVIAAKVKGVLETAGAHQTTAIEIDGFRFDILATGATEPQILRWGEDIMGYREGRAERTMALAISDAIQAKLDRYDRTGLRTVETVLLVLCSESHPVTFNELLPLIHVPEQRHFKEIWVIPPGGDSAFRLTIPQDGIRRPPPHPDEGNPHPLLPGSKRIFGKDWVTGESINPRLGAGYRCHLCDEPFCGEAAEYKIRDGRFYACLDMVACARRSGRTRETYPAAD